MFLGRKFCMTTFLSVVHKIVEENDHFICRNCKSFQLLVSVCYLSLGVIVFEIVSVRNGVLEARST